MYLETSLKSDGIEDLEDADRPSNLVKLYEDLYDNEFTSAFDELASMSSYEEFKVYAILKEILMVSIHLVAVIFCV